MTQMNDNAALTPFNFEGADVRLIDRDGEPWFVLADVCRVLEIVNVGNASARLDDDERDSIRNPDVIHSAGNPNITIINESGLYSLVLTSRKPAAKRFKKWVTAEVLPTLRRTGMYVMDAEAEDLPSLADGKLWGVRVAKVNAAARMLSAANALYGPEAARALWEMEKALPDIRHKQPGALAGTVEDDPTGCWRHLMRVAAGPGRTIGAVLQFALSDAIAASALLPFGLRLGPQQMPDALAVACVHPFLAECFADTQWAGEWRIALAQIPGARASHGLVTFTRKVESRAVLIPRRQVIDLLYGGSAAALAN